MGEHAEQSRAWDLNHGSAAMTRDEFVAGIIENHPDFESFQGDEETKGLVWNASGIV